MTVFMVESQCPQCGVAFAHRRSVSRTYCSRPCHDAAREKRVVCGWCKALYRPGQNKGRKYCSRECSSRGRVKPRDRACRQCGSPFTPVVTTSTQRYCSQSCRGDAIRGTHYGPSVELTCEQCGKQWTVAPSHAVNRSNGSRKRFCSRACKGLASRQRWPVERTNQLLYRCEECGKEWHDKRALRDRKRFCSRECLGVATVKKLRADNPSSIEVETYQALSDLGIDFVPQFRIGHFLVDAYVPGRQLVIECLGDFHHCNPSKYPDGPKHAIQKKTVGTDRHRFRVLLESGYHLLILWEADIRAVGARQLIETGLKAKPSSPL